MTLCSASGGFCQFQKYEGISSERTKRAESAAGIREKLYVFRMQVSENVSCPFCGQTFELMIDTTVSTQRFTTDCEVCCRPFEVVADCEPGEVISLDVLGG